MQLFRAIIAYFVQFLRIICVIRGQTCTIYCILDELQGGCGEQLLRGGTEHAPTEQRSGVVLVHVAEEADRSHVSALRPYAAFHLQRDLVAGESVVEPPLTALIEAVLLHTLHAKLLGT